MYMPQQCLRSSQHQESLSNHAQLVMFHNTYCVSACLRVTVQGEGVRAVSPDEGAAFAREHGCLYKETSAKNDQGGTDEGVYDALVWGKWGCDDTGDVMRTLHLCSMSHAGCM